MKQIIVMIAMMILGIGLGTMIMGFSDQAESIRDTGIQALTVLTDSMTGTGE